MTQEEFNQQFITALEISQMLNITRAAVLTACANDKLPEPISIGQSRMMIWNRSEIMPYIEKWKKVLNFRLTGQLENA